MPRKRLQALEAENEVTCVVRLRLKKVEEELFLAYAAAHRLRTQRGKPSLGAALVEVARVGLNCYAQHTDRYQEPKALSKDRLVAAGLSVVTRRWLRRDPLADGARYRRG